jgi:ADP-ribose pyrophosphatase YjhB (NUDIX family)
MPETTLFVGAIVRKGDSVLLVRQSAGHPLQGQWTVPWGRVEAGESPCAAAVREIREEGGIEAIVEGLLGVQELPSPQHGGIALAYLCRHVRGGPEPMDRETDAAAYYSLAALDALNEPIEPWSNWLVRRILSGNYTVVSSDSSNPLQSHGSYL